MRKPSTRFDGGIILVVLIGLIVVGVGIVVYFQVRTDRISEIANAGEDLAVLFVVEDSGSPMFTDVFLYNPTTGRGALFDVPSNVGLLIDSLQRVDRIAAVYEEQGIDAYRERVEALLGTPVPFYVDISIEELSNLVDLVGGVELFIANPQQDVENEDAVLLPSGNVNLDGGKIVTYLTFEDPAERSTERISRRQKFLQGFLGRIGETADFLTDRDVTPFVARNLETNLDRGSLLGLIRELRDFDSNRVVTRRIQGNVRTVEGTEGGTKLLFPHFEGEWLRQAVRQVRQNLASSEMVRSDALVIRVEILNGTNVSGLARRTKELYESYGFDVVSFGNAESSDVEETAILDRVGDPEIAGRVAEIIGANRIRTKIEEGVEYSVDATIVLGKDFDGTIVR